MSLNVVGGSYYEICRDPEWDELYGSGLRAAHALSQRGTNIIFNTYIGFDDYDKLSCICESIGVDLNAITIEETYKFVYDYPLANPYFIIPKNEAQSPTLHGELFLQFGTIEGNFKVNGKRVVYDPQSPGNPLSFWQENAFAEELIWVCNFAEAKAFASSSNFETIKQFLFE